MGFACKRTVCTRTDRRKNSAGRATIKKKKKKWEDVSLVGEERTDTDKQDVRPLVRRVKVADAANTEYNDEYDLHQQPHG